MIDLVKVQPPTPKQRDLVFIQAIHDPELPGYPIFPINDDLIVPGQMNARRQSLGRDGEEAASHFLKLMLDLFIRLHLRPAERTPKTSKKTHHDRAAFQQSIKTGLTVSPLEIRDGLPPLQTSFQNAAATQTCGRAGQYRNLGRGQAGTLGRPQPRESFRKIRLGHVGTAQLFQEMLII